MLRAGVDLGGTKIQAVILGPDDAVIGQHRTATPRHDGPRGVLEGVVACVLGAVTSADVTVHDLAGVGIGSPGQIDRDAGTVANSINMPEWGGSVVVPVADIIREALGIPVVLANDVQAGVWGEWRRGAGRGVDSMIGIFWGTGVGGGIILARSLWLGRGAAGEIGHVIVKQGGRRCACGRRGCMEAYAGRAAMEARARRLLTEGEPTRLFAIMEERRRDRLSAGVWARALDQADPMASGLVDEAVEALGIAASSAVNLLDVEAVVIGGGMGCRLGASVTERIAEVMRDHLVQPARAPQVLTASLGDHAGAIGAALLVDEIEVAGT